MSCSFHEFTTEVASTTLEIFQFLSCVALNLAMAVKQFGQFDERSNRYFSMKEENFSQTNSKLHLDNNFEAVVPFGWILDLNIKKKSHYDLSKFAQAGASMTVSIIYNGVTTVPSLPMPLSSDYTKGWFASDILSEAAQKSGKDATGYQINGSGYDPKNLFGASGKLRRMKTLVISQQPMITIHMSEFNYSQMSSVFTKESDVDLLLFGWYRIGGHDNGYTVTNYNEDSSKQ